MGIKNVKPLSDVVLKIFQKSKSLAIKYLHNNCGSCELFLATFQVLSQEKDPELVRHYEKLKSILNNRGITGRAFEEQFLQYSPVGAIPAEGETFDPKPNPEFLKINNNLRTICKTQARSAEVADLIMELFGDKSYQVNIVLTGTMRQVLQDKGDGQTDANIQVEEIYDEIISAFRKPRFQEIEALDQLPEMTNINKYVMEHPQVVINSDTQIKQIELGLSGRSIKSVVLTGKAGTGKTTYVYEFAQRINNGNVPSNFRDKIIYQLDPAALVAGTRYRGDFEEKLTNIISIIKENPDVILFIDELHTIVKLGDSEQGSNNAGNILKPYITRGEIQIIGATTAEEYTKYILPEKAFARRFFEVKISEPNRAETKEILKGILPNTSQYFNRDIQETLVDKIVELSDKYTLDQANPAKAINMLELACAYSKVFEESHTVVDVDDVIKSVQLKFDIFISESKLDDTKKLLFNTLLGQDEALNQVLKGLRIVDKGVCDPDRPLYSMILSGPSGTGKTETAKCIAKAFFGNENNLVKVNMGEYSSEIDVTKLVGSSAGYVGYDDETALIKGLREHPRSVVLFDEIEKGHPSVQKVLLNILDEGYLTDNKGNKVSFKNTIIIFTTNLGCNKDTGKAVGMGLLKHQETGKAMEENVKKALENHFRPEFLGRVDDIIIYNTLTKEVFETLINRYRDFYNEVSGLNIEFNDEDIEAIIKKSNIETRGARGLKSAVRQQFTVVELRNEEQTS